MCCIGGVGSQHTASILEQFYQSAMDREPASRGAYLAEACKDDEGLRHEVESLLRLNSSPVLIDQPAWPAAGELLDNDSIVAAGTQLGPYRIEGVLGAGGMAKSFARETRGSTGWSRSKSPKKSSASDLSGRPVPSQR
jgi:hypothetical protein